MNLLKIYFAIITIQANTFGSSLHTVSGLDNILHLRQGTSQNTDFDGQIADATICLVTHTILSLQRRFNSYETMGELFRETQQNLLELTLWERLIKTFLKIVNQMASILNIDIDEIIEKIIQSDQTSKQLLAMLKALEICEDNEQLKYKTGNSAITN
jgi:hypothetical protein